MTETHSDRGNTGWPVGGCANTTHGRRVNHNPCDALFQCIALPHPKPNQPDNKIGHTHTQEATKTPNATSWTTAEIVNGTRTIHKRLNRHTSISSTSITQTRKATRMSTRVDQRRTHKQVNTARENINTAELTSSGPSMD
jgi:hypothetical protein